MVTNLPSNTGDEGLILGQGRKIPHVAEQQGLSTATREAMRTPSAATKNPRQPNINKQNKFKKKKKTKPYTWPFCIIFPSEDSIVSSYISMSPWPTRLGTII